MTRPPVTLTPAKLGWSHAELAGIIVGAGLAVLSTALLLIAGSVA